ncbi:hypothetical protein ACJX0J_042492 [Zea mays]
MRGLFWNSKGLSDLAKFRGNGNRVDNFKWILMAIELNGRQFTWANSLPNPTYEKLDRVLMSTEWEVKYPLVSQLFYKGLFGDPLDNNISLDEEIIQDITQKLFSKWKRIKGQCHTTAYDKGEVAEEHEQIGGIVPHLIEGGLSILQYADDTILFLEHDLDKARNKKLILAAFEQLAWQASFSGGEPTNNKKKYRLARWDILCQPKEQGVYNRASTDLWNNFVFIVIFFTSKNDRLHH